MAPDNMDDLRKLDKNYKPNRAERRRKPIEDPSFTKATHKTKKERAKHVKSPQQRKRAAANARKARKESYSQVS